MKTLYSAPKTCIKNNGYLSETFDLCRGIRQECQISALIFIVAFETLGIRVRNSQSITGLTFGNNAKKYKKYHDMQAIACSFLTIKTNCVVQ